MGMATATALRTGAVSCTIITRYHVEPLTEEHPAVPTATANGVPVTGSGGRPLELHASSVAEATAMMTQWFEERYESR